MKFRRMILTAALVTFPIAAWANGNPKAGEELVMNSCTTCHASSATSEATDAAPPLSYIARDQKHNPDWIHAWLLRPHRAMSGIMLSRQQIDDVMAYLSTLPTG
jgi:mono/diheme cytochrome c family protein